MPLYEFRCPRGHTAEVRCKMDLSDAPKACETILNDAEAALVGPFSTFDGPLVCGKPVQKIMSTNARSFPGADKW